MTKISIIHPSRSRPEMALKTANHWIDNLSDQNEFEYLLCVDSSDPKLLEYSEHFEGLMVSIKECFGLVIANNTTLIQACNAGAKMANGDIFVLVSDDFLCYPNWDEDIVLAFEAFGPGRVLKTFDGVQKWIVTLPIMDRAYYERCGYLYHPAFTHMFCDTFMTHQADIEDRLIMRNDLVFTHAHYSTGATKKDAINIKADATWAQGEAAYLNLIKGMRDNNQDIWNISPEGAHHKNWLKARI